MTARPARPSAAAALSQLARRVREPQRVRIVPHRRSLRSLPGGRGGRAAGPLLLWRIPVYLMQPASRLPRLPKAGWWWLERFDPDATECDLAGGSRLSQGPVPPDAGQDALAGLAAAVLGFPVDIEPIGLEIFCRTPEARSEPAYLIWRRG